MTAMNTEKPVLAADDRIATIADAIVRAYGDVAALVARRQFDAADGASKLDWAAILQRLERR